MTDSPTAIAVEIIAANRYMTLATADADGRPWATPVYNAAIGSGQAVYAEAVAERLAGDELARGITDFTRVSEAHGAGRWSAADVQPPAELRLCRATVRESWVLEPGGRDIRCP